MTSEGTRPPPRELDLPAPALSARRSGLIDELSPQLEANPPCDLACAWTAFRQDYRELGWNLRIFGDDLHPAIRDVGDHAIPCPPAWRELYLRNTSPRTP